MVIRYITPETVQSSLRSIFLGEKPELSFTSVMLYLGEWNYPKPRKLRKPHTDFVRFANGLHSLCDTREETVGA